MYGFGFGSCGRLPRSSTPGSTGAAAELDVQHPAARDVVGRLAELYRGTSRVVGTSR